MEEHNNGFEVPSPHAQTGLRLYGVYHLGLEPVISVPEREESAPSFRVQGIPVQLIKPTLVRAWTHSYNRRETYVADNVYDILGVQCFADNTDITVVSVLAPACGKLKSNFLCNS